MRSIKPTQLRRNRLAGMLLRPFGYGYWGVEQIQNGFSFLGRGGKQIKFSELARIPKATKIWGFQTVTFPLKSGCDIKTVGLKPSNVASFISTAQSDIQDYFTSNFIEIESKLGMLAKVIARLENPRRYPSACLLEPFFIRISEVLDDFPAEVPAGALAENKQSLLNTIQAFRSAPQKRRAAAITKFIKSEINQMQEFFDTIESNPLTPEQREAVVTDEDATLVLAGAGSGKTSVIVAKAVYLIEQGIREPNEILLLAFSKDAAAEMASRTRGRSGKSIDALTFHALGYEIIGEVEGGAPALANHASDDIQFRALLRDILINEVGRISGMETLILKWFSEFFWPIKSEWDFKTLGEYYQYVESHELRTLNGERVKSFEELQIANWLYQNGVAYEYEPSYEHKLPKNDRRAYTPDFRLSESGVYIEHFGVRKARGSQCAQKARITSGGRNHPDSCRFDLVAGRRFVRVTGWTEAL